MDDKGNDVGVRMRKGYYEVIEGEVVKELRLKQGKEFSCVDAAVLKNNRVGMGKLVLDKCNDSFFDFDNLGSCNVISLDYSLDKLDCVYDLLNGGGFIDNGKNTDVFDISDDENGLFYDMFDDDASIISDDFFDFKEDEGSGESTCHVHVHRLDRSIQWHQRS